MIVTFYSYKGGVGRSMGLANVARWFQLQGLRVVMVDWDLEAPGLESFFLTDPGARDSARGAVGLVDMLVAYKDLFRSLPKPNVAAGADADADAVDFAKVLNDALPSLAHLLIAIRHAAPGTQEAGSLWLLPAGCRAGERFDCYAESVQQFNWAEFYEQYEGEAYFEWLRQQLLDPQLADVVLIDSRTGVAEMSGVCTRQLADVVVTMCAPNDQNLQGVEMMAKSFKRPDLLEARGGRPIELVMVGSRLDLSEGRPVDLFQSRFDAVLGPYVPAAFQRVGVDYAKLRIPYVSAYAYSERLAVGDPEGVKALQDAYETIAAHIALLARPGSTLRAKCQPTLQRYFSLPAVFVAYVPSAPYGFEERLLSAGVFATGISLRNLIDTRAPELLSSNANAAALLVIEVDVFQDRLLKNALRHLRANGVPTFLAASGKAAELLNRRPAGLGNALWFDWELDFDELAQALQKGGRVPRVPFLAPPSNVQLVGRDDVMWRIKAVLTSTHSPMRRVAIVGMGGIGKTAIARAVCDDDEVSDYFDGGILWSSFGPQPNLREAFAKWVAAFEGEEAAITDLDEAERRLAHHLAKGRCLIVLDDLLDWELLARIPAGDRCVILLTTCLQGGLGAGDTLLMEIGPLPTADAARLLVAELPVQPAAVAEKIVTRLGGSPLAIRLANRWLRVSGSSQGDAGALDSRLDSLLADIDTEGIDALGVEAQGVISAFTLATERLPRRDRSRLHLLAGLPSQVNVDVEEVRKAGISDAPGMLGRLSRLSLVEFDARSGTLVIPHLTHAFVHSLALQQRRVEQNRSAAGDVGALQIFISYRREDIASVGRLYDRLTERFGPRSISMDTEDLAIGEDFLNALRAKIDAANVTLVIIGRSGLANAGEFSLVEIGYALNREAMLVIPVLVDGARMPAAPELPPGLEPLARRNAVELRMDRFNQDTDYLIDAIEASAVRRVRQPSLPYSSVRPQATAASGYRDERKTRSRWRQVAAAACVLLAVGATAYFMTMSPAPMGSPAAETQFAQAEDLYFGRGVKQDYAQAARLYAEAAGSDYAPAQNALGRLYESGQGVTSNDAAAMAWYQRAADQGHPDAIAALKRLSSKAPPERLQWAAPTGYGVVVSGRRSPADALQDLATASKIGYPSGSIFRRDGYRAVVGTFKTEEQANEAARELSSKFKANNLYVRQLENWCVSPQPDTEGSTSVVVCAK